MKLCSANQACRDIRTVWVEMRSDCYKVHLEQLWHKSNFPKDRPTLKPELSFLSSLSLIPSSFSLLCLLQPNRSHMSFFSPLCLLHTQFHPSNLSFFLPPSSFLLSLLSTLHVQYSFWCRDSHGLLQRKYIARIKPDIWRMAPYWMSGFSPPLLLSVCYRSQNPFAT